MSAHTDNFEVETRGADALQHGTRLRTNSWDLDRYEYTSLGRRLLRRFWPKPPFRAAFLDERPSTCRPWLRPRRPDAEPHRGPRWLLSALLVTVAAPAAQAACPVAEDVQTGVRIDLDNGDYSIITRDADGVVREEEFLADLDESVTYVTQNGVIETAYLSPSEEESAFYAYSFPTDNILPLQPWAGQTGEQIERDVEDRVVGKINFAWRTRGVESIDIGGCTYEAIPLETLYTDEDGTSMTEFRYIVELGIPVVVGFYMDGAADLYPPVSISAVSD